MKFFRFIAVIIITGTLFSQEIEYLEIPLSGGAEDKRLEMSGLAWYGDFLVLLPQNINKKSPAFYFLRKNEILNWLKSDKKKPLSPRPVPVILPDFDSTIDGFQGFEAIYFFGERIFLLIEAKSKQGMVGYLAQGQVSGKLEKLIIDAELTTVQTPLDLTNMAYESMLFADSKLMAFYEANGSLINLKPEVKSFSLELKPQGNLSFPSIEYRITDVTAIDENGRFWALNFYWPGEKEVLNPGEDLLKKKFVSGKTHNLYEHVERLIELQLKPGGFELTDTAPIQLKLDQNETHNWEGLVRLDDLGFIMITDEYPRTILAFAPLLK